MRCWVWYMEVCGAHIDVMGWGVVLRVIVSQIGGPWAPVDVKVALLDSVFKPIEGHVDCFGAFLFDGVG